MTAGCTVPVHPHVEFCGVVTAIERTPFTIGRDADLSVDDNPYLHRRLVAVDRIGALWTVTNVGSQLSVALVDRYRRVEAQLAPGGTLALSSSATTVRFGAGPTTYELTVHLPAGPVRRTRVPLVDVADVAGADVTVGRLDLSPEQLLLLVVLAEPVLRWGHPAAAVPSNAAAAARLGWSITKFNRKLDTVCAKVAGRGVRGIRGGPRRLAVNRRALLVEHAVASRLVTVADLDLLAAHAAR